MQCGSKMFLPSIYTFFILSLATFVYLPTISRSTTFWQSGQVISLCCTKIILASTKNTQLHLSHLMPISSFCLTNSSSYLSIFILLRCHYFIPLLCIIGLIVAIVNSFTKKTQRNSKIM